MNKKVFLITLVLAALIVIIAAIIYFFNQVIIGDSPSYVKPSSCSGTAQFVIRTKVFPENLIHSCKTSQHIVDGKKFYVVKIEYGPAHDCPSGCFYNFFVGAIPVDQQTIIELPGTPGNSKNSILTTVYDSLPQHDFSKIDFKCNADLDTITTMELAKRNEQIGWQLILTTPYLCSWKEVKSTKVTMDNIFVHTADEITRSWDGSMFVVLENENYQWYFDKLKSKEVAREEVVFEER